MPKARWILCERTGRWAAACRIQLLQRGPSAVGRLLCETRTQGECQQMLRRWPASLVAVEVTRTDFAAWITWIADLEHTFPAALAVVLSQLDLPEADWALREAGALWIASSPRALAPVTELALRHVGQAPSLRLDVAEWAQPALPWAD
ncbi:MAG: hypothetical protein A2W31_03725 [Planctomycetes bacterium RBG_16_64_10]|nr:MAG: hypothetical protein A2W31_03725 [Planctomycetes bacterium RBG_16_64_10]